MFDLGLIFPRYFEQAILSLTGSISYAPDKLLLNDNWLIFERSIQNIKHIKRSSP